MAQVMLVVTFIQLVVLGFNLHLVRSVLTREQQDIAGPRIFNPSPIRRCGPLTETRGGPPHRRERVLASQRSIRALADDPARVTPEGDAAPTAT